MYNIEHLVNFQIIFASTIQLTPDDAQNKTK